MESPERGPGGPGGGGPGGPAGASDADGEAERDVIRAAQAGDASAFEELVRRHRDRVFAVACRVVGNREDARDVAQNVLVRLWRVLPKYDERYAFTTWLYRMTVNLSIDALRRAAPRLKETELDEGLLPPAGAHPGRSAPSPGSPERAFAAGEVERIFAELATLLPPQQRAAFALREMEGLSSEEVGRVLGLTESTVRNHVFQARRTLRTALEARYPEYLPKRGRKS